MPFDYHSHAELISPAIPNALVVLPVGSKSLHLLSFLTELLAVGPHLGTFSAELLGVRLQPLLVGKNLLVELLCILLILNFVSASSGRRLAWVLSTGHCRARSHHQRSGQGCR